MNTTRDAEFRDFVQQQRPQLVRTATLLAAGDRHLAEDLVQSTLTKLYVKWPAFQRARAPQAYLRRMLANAAIDESRRPWRRRELYVAEVPDHATTGVTGGVDGEALRQALQALPPRMRAAVVFRYFHELSVAETADALGCSQGTVKSQTARALDHLRRALGPGLDIPPELDDVVPAPAPLYRTRADAPTAHLSTATPRSL